MKKYPNQELQVMPQPKPYHLMTDEELEQVLTTATNYNILIPALIEKDRRKDKIISELNKRILRLEEKTLKKAGRHKQSFLHNGEELTDDEIVRLIDEGHYHSGELHIFSGNHKKLLAASSIRRYDVFTSQCSGR